MAYKQILSLIFFTNQNIKVNTKNKDNGDVVIPENSFYDPQTSTIKHQVEQTGSDQTNPKDRNQSRLLKNDKDWIDHIKNKTLKDADTFMKQMDLDEGEVTKELVNKWNKEAASHIHHHDSPDYFKWESQEFKEEFKPDTKDTKKDKKSKAEEAKTKKQEIKEAFSRFKQQDEDFDLNYRKFEYSVSPEVVPEGLIS